MPILRNRLSKSLIFFTCALLSVLISGCEKKQKAYESASPKSEQELLVENGRRVYLNSCTACHHPDPSKDGSIGPAVSGSSFELLSAKVLKSEYPTNYKPKRETKAMAALPHLEKELGAIHAFLNQASTNAR